MSAITRSLPLQRTSRWRFRCSLLRLMALRRLRSSIFSQSPRLRHPLLLVDQATNCRRGLRGCDSKNINQRNVSLAVYGFKLNSKRDGGTSRRGCNRLIADNRRVILKGRKCSIAANSTVQKVGGNVQNRWNFLKGRWCVLRNVREGSLAVVSGR